MPHIRPSCPIDYGIGQILFAGEVAGFLNPMGEGISAGIECGCCAAKAILQHYDDVPAVLSQYEENTNELHNYMKRQWGLIAEMADTFADMKL